MTGIKEFSHFVCYILMVKVQLVMSLSAVKAKFLCRFGNFAFLTLSDSKPNVLFELIFIAFLFVTDAIIALCILELVFCIFSYFNTDNGERFNETFSLIHEFAIQSSSKLK